MAMLPKKPRPEKKPAGMGTGPNGKVPVEQKVKKKPRALPEGWAPKNMKPMGHDFVRDSNRQNKPKDKGIIGDKPNYPKNPPENPGMGGGKWAKTKPKSPVNPHAEGKSVPKKKPIGYINPGWESKGNTKSTWMHSGPKKLTPVKKKAK